MKPVVHQAIHILRYGTVGVLIIAALVFHYRKWDGPALPITADEATQACKAVAGCKSATLGKTFNVERARWVPKLTVVADRKARNADVPQKVASAIGDSWNAKTAWLGASWDGHALEVHHE